MNRQVYEYWVWAENGYHSVYAICDTYKGALAMRRGFKERYQFGGYKFRIEKKLK